MAEQRRRAALLVSVIFLAVTAMAGGIGLLSGAIAPPLDLLTGSLLSSYAIPGMALVVLVGGSASAATMLLLGRHQFASEAAIISAAMIVMFEIVEILVIGSPPGIARTLQIFYIGLGVGIAVLARWN